MLLEEETVPRSFISDLQKIHAGGRQLVALISEYFDDDTFATKTRESASTLPRVAHAGESHHRLQRNSSEQAEDIGRKKFIPDLKKIHTAATMWLALMEEHLIAPDSSGAPSNISVEPMPVLNQGVGFRAPSARGSVAPCGSLLSWMTMKETAKCSRAACATDGHT
jgi:hypothetical protein